VPASVVFTFDPNNQNLILNLAIFMDRWQMAVDLWPAFLFSLPAHAKDNGQWGSNVSPELRAWFNDVYNRKGIKCCDAADGYPVMGWQQMVTPKKFRSTSYGR
jgi:hypothetical protein